MQAPLPLLQEGESAAAVVLWGEGRGWVRGWDGVLGVWGALSFVGSSVDAAGLLCAPAAQPCPTPALLSAAQPSPEHRPCLLNLSCLCRCCHPTPPHLAPQEDKHGPSYSCSEQGITLAVGKYGPISFDEDGNAFDWHRDEEGRMQQVQADVRAAALEGEVRPDAE